MKWRLTSLIAACLSLSFFPTAASTLYVDLNSTNPTPPYADMTTAATSIQDAVDASTNGDLILVNDGIYQNGFKTTTRTDFFPPNVETNRVVIDKPVTVGSLNGPLATIINGGGIYRCVFLTNGATLSGFTLMSGAAGWLSPPPPPRTITGNGGGVTGSMFGGGVVSNCVLTGNSAAGNGGGACGVTLINCLLKGNQATNGGGAASSTLLNCIITSNSVPSPGGQPGFMAGEGGGIYGGIAVNCLIAGNRAFHGGGTWGTGKLINCTIVSNSASFYGGVCPNTILSQAYYYVTNSIIYFNSAGTNANYGPGNLIFDHSCSLPMPASGSGNLTNAPTFVDFAHGDYHLAPDSPVINAGSNAVMTNSTDLDGNSRIVGGTVDIGAYEYQTPSSKLSYAWARQYGLPTDGTGDNADPDGDGMNNWQEFVVGTNPTNVASHLAMSSAILNKNLNWVVVKWQSVNTRTYYLERSTNLSQVPPFAVVQSNLSGQTGTTTVIDTTATNGGPYFYRVGVQ